MKKILFSLIVFSFALAASAQDGSNVKKPSIALRISALDFTTARDINVNTLGGVLNNRTWAKLGDATPSIGLQYFKGLTSNIDFMANLDFASLQYPFYASSNIRFPAGRKLYTAFDANVNFKMLSDDYKVVPYVTLGIGVGVAANVYYTAYAPAGFGLQIKANKGSFININSTYRAEMSQLTKAHFSHGVSYSMPLNFKEKKAIVLPPPPPPAPADTDNDGVIDEKDKCPTVAGLAKYNGCPIPDTDKDGVNDEQDKCPTVAGLAKYNGCPIPDTDKDGINDEEDKCPTVAGISANHGCPDVQPTLTTAAEALKFETGKSYLSKKQLAGLSAVVAVLNQYPNVSVAIAGHTDNTGAERLNSKLSINRANVVAKFLAKAGVDAKRLTSAGFGYSKPSADNKTKVGRAQNRRAELTAVYN
jgi:outer membrane protein OmpA-like peptidoglycan-associated protein